MTETIHNKLVRDKIPEIIQTNGDNPTVRRLDAKEYKTALLQKLVEEATELLESDGDIDERADVAEVLRSIDAVCGFSQQAVEAVRVKKAAERGGFANRVFLEKVERNGDA